MRFHPAVEGFLCRHYDVGAVAGGTIFSESGSPHKYLLECVVPKGAAAENVVARAIRAVATEERSASKMVFESGDQKRVAFAFEKAEVCANSGYNQLVVIVHEQTAGSAADGLARKTGGRKVVYFPEKSIGAGTKLGWEASGQTAPIPGESYRSRMAVKAHRHQRGRHAWHISEGDGAVRGPRDKDEWKQERASEQLCPVKITVYFFFGKEQTDRVAKFNVNELTGIIVSTTALTKTPMETKPPSFLLRSCGKNTQGYVSVPQAKQVGWVGPGPSREDRGLEPENSRRRRGEEYLCKHRHPGSKHKPVQQRKSCGNTERSACAYWPDPQGG